MSQNNNLSIDEILREAQEVLSSIGGDSVSGESAEAQQDDVKTYVPQKKADQKQMSKQSLKNLRMQRT